MALIVPVIFLGGHGRCLERAFQAVLAADLRQGDAAGDRVARCRRELCGAADLDFIRLQSDAFAGAPDIGTKDAAGDVAIGDVFPEHTDSCSVRSDGIVTAVTGLADRS